MSEAWSTLRSQIEFFSKPFPEDAIVFADAHRAEVAPFLVESIAQVAEGPLLGDDPDYVLHLYAMHLLATWRDTAVNAPLVRLGHHPDEIVDRLLGDSVTESYGRCLASVCDGDLTPLRGLVEDASAAYWARHAALDALMARVIEGDAPRDDLIAYLMRLGDAEATRLRLPGNESSMFELLDGVVSVATDIGAIEMLERIRGWFAEELVDPQIADLAWVEAHISRPYETCREEYLRHEKGYVVSVKREIGWWAGFREDEPVSARSAPVIIPVRQGPKIGRNEPCPCGSGKKYKKCCGG